MACGRLFDLYSARCRSGCLGRARYDDRRQRGDDFVFATAARGLVIRDFTPGTDRLLFAFGGDIDVSELRMTDQAEGLRIRLAGFGATLQGVTTQDFQVDDLVFGPDATAQIDGAIDAFLANWAYG